MKRVATSLFALAVLAASASADATFQTLPYSQNWSNTAMITTNNNWSGVPGWIGYLGDDGSTTTAGVDPRTLTADVVTTVNVTANQANASFISGGVIEAEFGNPVIAMQGSGTGDFPNIVLHLNTTGFQNIQLAFNYRDIDNTSDNTNQQMNAQYRIGTSGVWTNIAGTYVADATTGPSLAVLVTPISVTLPAAVNNQPQVQIRFMTTNAPSNDEYVGVDDISIVGDAVVPALAQSWGKLKAMYK